MPSAKFGIDGTIFNIASLKRRKRCAGLGIKSKRGPYEKERWKGNRIGRTGGRTGCKAGT
jgi:hypothetical protein